MRKSWMIGGLAVLAAAALGLGGARSAVACEPIHTLLLFGSETPPPPPPGQILVPCAPGQVICNNPANPTNCVTCGQLSLDRLCWASKCRKFDSDSGQFGQFKKDYPGELEAIIIESWNLETNEIVTLVDKVANPTCTTQIPAASNKATCEGLYKVKGISPRGTSAPLCTFDNLDDVNTVARTPASQNVVLTDVNGLQCDARRRAGDQWWMFYQYCCSPASAFGSGGNRIATAISLVFDNNGTCRVDSVRPDASDPERIPTASADPCL